MTNFAGPTVSAPRFTVTIFLTVGEEMRPFGRTRDLSVSGAFVETGERPEIGSTPEIAIVWGEDTLLCRARVVRHSTDGIGVTFLDPEISFTRAIEDIVNSAPLKRPRQVR